MAEIRAVDPLSAEEQEAARFAAIEEAVVVVARGMAALEKSRVSERLVVVLVQKDTGLTERNIRDVLRSLRELETKWLKPKNGRASK